MPSCREPPVQKIQISQKSQLESHASSREFSLVDFVQCRVQLDENLPFRELKVIQLGKK